MAHPVGYFSLDRNNPLVADMCEKWGEGLEKMSESDTIWLIARVAHEAWLEGDFDVPPSNEVSEVVERLHQLSYTEKLALIQALTQ